MAWLVSLLFFSPAFANPVTSELHGVWQYDGFFYEGHRYPNPNPNLILRMTFTKDGIEELFWTHTDQVGTCDRKATYALKDDTLIAQVFWVDSNNGSECSKDPDMQPNRWTENRILIQGQGEAEELHLILQLHNENFDYILKRVR